MKEFKEMSLEELLDRCIYNGINHREEILSRFAEKDTAIDDLFALACKYSEAITLCEEKMKELNNIAYEQASKQHEFVGGLNNYISSLQQQVEDLKRETGVLITCRDHWKTSYETLNKLLHGEKECKKCHGIGYTIFYEHKSYLVPHENKHEFLCNCLSNNLLNFIKKER